MTRHRPARLGLPRAALLLTLGGLVLGGCGAASPAATSAVRSSEAPSATFLMNEGRAAAARGDTVRAEQYVALAIDRGYDERRALSLLLSVCIQGSRLRTALNYAEPYLRNHPKDVALRYLVGSIQVSLGDEEGARRELDTLLRDDPDHAEALFLSALLDVDRDPALAGARLRDYLRLEPSGHHAADARVRLRELERRREEDARLLGLDSHEARKGRTTRGNR